MEVFRTATGNDLLAELAEREAALKAEIPSWRAAAALKAERLREWTLASTLIDLGATEQAGEAAAIQANRSLLAEPNPVTPLLAAAAEALRNAANAAHAAYRTVWEEGEARLRADMAWGKMTPETRRTLRATHHLLELDAPDLATPAKIAESLRARGISQWRDLAAAHPGRVEAALRDAALELEPKTQMIPIPRRALTTAAELEQWLEELRAAIAPLLPRGPVLPTA